MTTSRAQAEQLRHNDESLKDFKCAVVILSDRASRKEYEDKAGPVALACLAAMGAEAMPAAQVIPDDADSLARALRKLQMQGIQLVITSGGTGIGPRDITPETLRKVGDKVVDGIGELVRAAGAHYTPTSYLSRSVAVTMGQMLIVALPGNPNAVRESLEALQEILPHALATLLKGA